MAPRRKHVKKKKGILKLMASAFRRFSSPNVENHSTEIDAIGKWSSAFAAHMTMHQLAREGNVKMMERLLERIPQLQVRKKRLNQPDEFKLAPIHYAARYNHRHMIEYLIKNGASTRSVTDDGSTVLHFLAKYKHKSIDHWTPRKTKDRTAPESEREESKQLNCIELLVESEAQVNAKNAAGQTPLHLACERENIEMVKELLECNELALDTIDNQEMTALHLACLNGHSNIVRLLVEAGADLRCSDKEMMTPMHVACCEGYIEIAEILFEAGEKQRVGLGDRNLKQNTNNGNLSRQSSHNVMYAMTALHVSALSERKIRMQMDKVPPYDTGPMDNNENPTGGVVLLLDLDIEMNLPLHLAIEYGHLILANFSIEKTKAAGVGSMIDSMRSENDSCLHLAVQANSIEIVKLLLDEGADINSRNSFLVTPLHLACQQNAHVIVKHLAESGCDIETKDTDYMTPFLVASRYCHLETLTLLIEHNADVTATDKDNKTCLMLATEEDRDDVIRLLLEYKASTANRNEADQNSLHMAELHGHHAIIADLANRDNSIINVEDEEANTVLHLAAISGNIKGVTILIQLGANLGVRNLKQWTALDCACAFGFVKSAKALLEAGAAIEPSGKVKISPLHLACQRGHVEVVELLLEWKADVTFRSIEGRNALDYAIDFGQRNCVLVLIKHPTWRDSLKNAYIYPVTGRLITPMKKLIMKMEDMAEMVCNQCMQDTGKKTDDDQFEITLFYELLDDVYSFGQWIGNSDAGTHQLAMTDEDHTLQYECCHETEDSYSYTEDSDILQANHPLMLMVGLAVGDIIKVQENASLERFRMQVDLALEVEFALPEFLRKKLCLGKQNIRINKYRKANFFKRLLFGNKELKLEGISKYLDKEEVDQNNDLTNMENMIIGMDNLRNRMTDLLSEVADVRQAIHDVRGKLIEVQREIKLQAQLCQERVDVIDIPNPESEHSKLSTFKDLKVDFMSSENELNERIQQSHSDQIEATQFESILTQKVASFQEDVARARRQTEEVILTAKERLKSMQEQTFRQQWHNLESTQISRHS